MDAAYVPVPPRVVDTCAQLAAAAGHRDFERGALAGLINYYRAGDALAGHVDDAERDMSAPIVSVSLGCPCIFLLGGTDRDVTPTAVLMRSGDAVVLSGASRSCYHGLPRIFTAEEGCLDGAGDALGCPEYLGNPEAWREEPDVARYIANGRVNVSVRVVD
jgi:alkylated DNA repair protein alkB family protein 1